MTTITIHIDTDCYKPKPPPRYRLVARLYIDNNSHNQIKGQIMAITLETAQEVTVEFSALDRRGKAASVESATITSSDEAVFTVTQDADNPLKAVVRSVGAGVAQLDISADADLDDDETTTITDFLAVEVKNPEAVGFGAPTVSEPIDV